MSGTITALKAQRSGERVNVHLDGEFAFGLALINALWLSIGQVLTDEQIETLKAADSLETAKRRAVDFIAYRPRTVSEVRRRLAKAGADDATKDRIVRDLREAGLLDDSSFSQQWVESRLRNSPRSRRMLEWELRQKGVDGETASRALDEAEVDDEQVALDAARRRLPRLAGLPVVERKRKLSDFLARSGFDFRVIQDVVATVLDETDKLSNETAVEQHHGKHTNRSTY